MNESKAADTTDGPGSRSPSDVLRHQEVTMLLQRYAIGVDTRDFGLVRSCFMDDAQGDYEADRPCVGADEIVTLIERSVQPLESTMHLVSNVLVQGEGDDAVVVSFGISHLVRASGVGREVFVRGLKYTDRLTRAEGRWLIAERRRDVHWMTRHVDIGPALPPVEG